MKILYLVHRLPWPPTKGDKIRSWRWLRALAEEHEVWLGTLVESDEEREAAEEIRDLVAGLGVFRRPSKARGALAAFTGRSLSEEVFRSRDLVDWVRRTVEEARPRVALAFSSTMAQYLEGFRRARVMDLVDVDSEKWRRYAERLPAASVYRLEAVRLRRKEEEILRRFDRVTVVSAAEAERLEDSRGVLEVLPNGVDAEAFRPGPVAGRQRGGIVFTGAMDYEPNVDAARWFAREVLPLVRAETPDASFTIVGSNPLREVRELAGIDGVSVTGTVPEVLPFLHAAEVAVAPLRIAMGIQNKVLEAMAAGLPVVASPGAAEGIDAEPGRHFEVSDGAEPFAEAVSGLLADGDRRCALGAAARELVMEKYRWEPVMRRMERILLEVANGAGHGS